jgi:uncharacterized membrane protein (UPF0127 family)
MINNITKNTFLCKNKKILRSMLSTTKGLMFSKKIIDTGYIFVLDKPARIKLHTFMVFFPIDVLFLNENRIVIEIKENLRPFMFYSSKNKIKYVVELPEKTISNSRTCKFDKIDF